MGPDDMARALRRVAHEIVERTGATDGLVLAGIETRGVPLADRLARTVRELGREVETMALSVEQHRDDRQDSSPARAGGQEGDRSAPSDITGRVVVLVDDVIFHGRTARAALDALTEQGRPGAVQLAVLVDRGHRELPIRADFVGKNIPTRMSDRVQVMLSEVDGRDAVCLVRNGA